MLIRRKLRHKKIIPPSRELRAKEIRKLNIKIKIGEKWESIAPRIDNTSMDIDRVSYLNDARKIVKIERVNNWNYWWGLHSL